MQIRGVPTIVLEPELLSVLARIFLVVVVVAVRAKYSVTPGLGSPNLNFGAERIIFLRRCCVVVFVGVVVDLYEITLVRKRHVRDACT